MPAKDTFLTMRISSDLRSKMTDAGKRRRWDLTTAVTVAIEEFLTRDERSRKRAGSVAKKQRSSAKAAA